MTALTPAIIQAFADAARQGIPLKSACRIINVPDATFRGWCDDAERDHRHHGATVSANQKAAAIALVSAIQRARAEHEAELVQRIANQQDARGNHDWRADAFLLTHGSSRQNWYEHKSSSQTITVQHHEAHTSVRELPDAELLALPDGESANDA